MNATVSKIIEVLVNSGELKPSETSGDKFGFYGERTEYGGIKNNIADNIVKTWLQSADPHAVKAAQSFPENFVFFTAQEQHDSMSPENQLLYHQNHKRRFTVRNKMTTYNDSSNRPIDNHCFICVGNSVYPKTRHDAFIMDLSSYVTKWLVGQRTKIKYSGSLYMK